MTTIHLGYEVGTGQAVEIPIRHMAITGQTQESGKTTTLEALITRSGLRAVTFVTKRGEESFQGAHRIRPYFKDQGGWEFVASILEASRGEKLKFERAWIIRASKGAATLAQVHANVKRAVADPKQRGMSADVYLTLDAYLEVVVPTIASIAWADALELQPGVNAIDLTTVPDEMQHLVIRSCIEWVHKREKSTIVVVPEAWKFVPQGRGTPVKMAAVALMRQGAALKNYVWLDSQDVGGIDKETLRQVPVWLLGVQRETNEVKRTLDNIPDGIAKPKKADISLLGLGQFYVCWGKHAIRTYVQPAWLESETAIQIALGKAQVVPPPVYVSKNWRFTGFQPPPPRPSQRGIITNIQSPLEEDTVDAAEAASLLFENSNLKNSLAKAGHEIELLHKKIEELSTRLDQPPKVALPFPATPLDGNIDGMYEALKARLLADRAVLLKLETLRPAIQIEVATSTVSVDGSTFAGRVARLMATGWFDHARTVGAVRQELKRTGTDPGGGGTLYDIIKRYHRDGFLVLDGPTSYVLAPHVKRSDNTLTAT